jgi:hypothetical protein
MWFKPRNFAQKIGKERLKRHERPEESDLISRLIPHFRVGHSGSKRRDELLASLEQLIRTDALHYIMVSAKGYLSLATDHYHAKRIRGSGG